MAKKSKVLRELEAMEMKEKLSLEEADHVRNTVLARLQMIHALKDRLDQVAADKPKARRTSVRVSKPQPTGMAPMLIEKDAVGNSD